LHEGIRRGGGAHQQECEVRQDHADRRADLRKAAVEAAPLARSILCRDQHGAAPLTADRDALCEAQHDQQQRCGHADGRIRWQTADQCRCRTHQHERHDQRLLAAEAIAVVPEDDAADRPGDESRLRRY
jgi:hypothetical protein